MKVRIFLKYFFGIIISIIKLITKVYRNETDLINKNNRVNVKRIMRSSTAPLRAQ